MSGKEDGGMGSQDDLNASTKIPALHISTDDQVKHLPRGFRLARAFSAAERTGDLGLDTGSSIFGADSELISAETNECECADAPYRSWRLVR